MAGESYYYVFSVIAVLLALVHVVNLVCFKVRSKTILGEDVRRGMPGFEKFQKLSSTFGVTIAAISFLALIVNLSYAIARVMSVSDPEYKTTMLLYAPVVIVLFFVVMLLVMRNKLKSGKQR